MQSSMRYVLLALGILVCILFLTITSTSADIWYLDKVCPISSSPHSAIIDSRPAQFALHPQLLA